MMTPQTEEQLAEMVRNADAPIEVQGGGTRGIGAAGNALSVAGLSGVTLYEPGALTLVAQAGTPVAEIEKVLALEHQRLAFEPMDHRVVLGTEGVPTIGGVIAGNVSGPRRLQVGAARDFALGVRFVDGAGNIIKNGGRVMKNVTGYDLVKLMCGAWGTLGVLTEISLKVLPLQETETTLVLPRLDPVQAVAAMSRALGSPFDLTGAAYDGMTGRTLMRLEGFAKSVSYRAGELSQLLGEVEVLQGADSAAVWADIRDVRAFADRTGDVWRVSVKPSDGPGVVAASGAEAAVMDWGGGLVWLLMPEGSDLRARISAFPGHATLVRAQAETKARLGMFHPEAAGVSALSVGLRAKFDPRGLFNPGLMTAAKAA